MAEVRRNRTVVLAAVCSVIAGVGAWVSTTLGAGLTPDSVSYLATGANLFGGKGLVDYTLQPLTVFPPGYGFLIAVGHQLGMTTMTSARVLNVAAVAATVWFGSVLLRRHVRSSLLVACATVLLGTSVHLLADARMVWSEPIFLLVMVGFVLALEGAVGEARTGRWFWAAVGLVWAAFLVRYAGMALVPAGALVLFGARRDRLVKAVAFVAAASAVPLLWLLRNRSVDGTLMGPRSPSPDSVGVALDRVMQTFGYWLRPEVPGGTDYVAAGIIALILLGSCAAVAGWWTWRRRPDPASAGEVSLAALVAVVACYIGYLVFAQVTTAFDPINTRLLSPVYVPLVVVITVGVDRAASLLGWRPLRVLGAVAVVIVVALNAVVYVRGVAHDRDTGLAIFPSAMQTTPVIVAVSELPEGDVVYAAAPALVAWLSGHQPVLSTPPSTELRTDVPLPIPDSFVESVACTPSWLVELGPPPAGVHPVEELAEVVAVTLVEEWPDGRLYQLTAKPGSTCG